ncbi:hypothetical protein [Janthinobacterium sp. JC611]|uniref:hypothetical protein n=1 Tax=Janthinobacterium sp. JC611 TaxID=2816201 RepID=UPI001BFCE650|nr:hypothetical protein [Janthinobacterium sp. JC611]
MKHVLGALLLQILLSCAAGGIAESRGSDLMGLDSFTLAARYGTPATYQHRGEYSQLIYRSEATGRKVIVLVDQAGHVVGWASSGAPPAAAPGKMDTQSQNLKQ